MLKKRVVIGIFLLSMAGLFCTDPVKITDDKPQIMDSGYRLARQLIFGLQSLRTIHDIQEVTQPVSFPYPLLDTVAVALRPWNPAGVIEFYNPSLAKIQAVGSVFAAADTPVIDPDSILDSALALGDSTYITIYRLKAGVLDTPWTAGHDSLFWRIAAGDTDTISLVRIRTAPDIGATITDRIAWSKSALSGWKFMRRLQLHSDTLTLRTFYTHAMSVNNGIIYDTLVTDQIRRKEYVFIIRRDNSTGPWNAIDSSSLYGYFDSLWTADSTLSVTVSSADSDSVVYDFSSSAAQTIKTHTMIRREQAKTWLTEDITTLISPAQTAAVIAYGQTVVRDLIDSVSYSITDIDTVQKTASLYTRVKPLRAGAKDMTQFGLRTETRYHFSADFSAGWDSLSYIGLDRTDYVSGPDSVLRVDWNAGATDILPSISRLTVKATYKTGHPTTAFRIWTRVYPDTLTYLWVGVGNDSTQVRWKYGANTITYNYDRPLVLAHSGSVSWPADSQAADTLRSLINPGTIARRFMGNYAGDSGSFKVYTSQYAANRDSFSLRFVTDSFIIVSPDKTFLPDSLTWQFLGNQWRLNFKDTSLAVDIRYRFFMDFSGNIIGAMDAVNSSAVITYWTNPLTIGIEGLGTAKLFGVVTGDPSVSANLLIDMWNESFLENYSLFQ